MSSINTLSSLKQAVGISVLKMQQSGSAAQAAVMLEDFTKAQESTRAAQHPTLGKVVDVRV